MDMLISLWLPIVLSSVLVFIASALAWMVSPHHKRDWVKPPREEELLQALRGLNLPPENYMFPHAATSEEMKSEEFQNRYKEGPIGSMTIFKGPPNMGVNMALTFAVFLVASILIAYVSGLAREAGAGFLDVFQVVGTVGILTYTFGGLPNDIWFGRKMAGNLLDGIVYGLLTGLVFAALWPAAS